MLLRLLISLLFVPLMTCVAHSEARIALLIGNKDYKPGVGALINPHNDVRIVGNALKAIGFEVLTPRLNANRSEMLLATYEFAAKLKSAGANAVGFLYYAGHGAASAGENYLIPVDVLQPSSEQLSVHGVKQSELLAILRAEAPNAAHFLVLDACRNNLQGTRGARGFLPVSQSGALIAFAAEPGKSASDGQGANGPYAEALAAELAKPGQSDLIMFHNVRITVIEKTGGDQVPWTEDGIQRRRRVMFGGEVKGGPFTAEQLSAAAREWEGVDKTSVAELEMFIRRHGASSEAEYARARIDVLKRRVSLASPPSSSKHEHSATTLRSESKKALLQANPWVQCNGVTCSFDRLAQFSPALGAIELASVGTGKRKSLVLDRISDDDLLRKSSFRQLQPVLFPVDAKGAKVALTFYDGSRSEERTILPSPGASVLREMNVRGDGKHNAPAVYGTLTGFVNTLDWLLIIDRPASYEKTYYTLDQGGFFEAKLGGYDRDEFRGVYNILKFRPPFPGEVLRLKFRDSSGQDYGPFEYDVDWKAISATAFAPPRGPDAISCRYYAKLVGDPFSVGMRQTDQGNTDWWFVDLKKDSIACRGGGLSWLGVQEVKIGRDPDALSMNYPVSFTVDDLIAGRLDYHMVSPRKIIWHAVVEGPRSPIYAQFVYRDGSHSEVYRLAIGQ
jgi:uncharacterized caspase-like protein